MRGDAAVDDLERLLLDRAPDAIEDEAGALPAYAQRQQPDPPPERQQRRDRLRRGGATAAHLDQRLVPNRVVEVEVGALAGARGGVLQEADPDRGAVGRQDRALAAVLVELAEDRALQLHALRHRLDHQIRVAHRRAEVGLVAQVRGDDVRGAILLQRQPRREPAPDRPRLCPSREGQRRRVGVVDRHRHPVPRDLQRDLPAHRPRPDHRHPFDPLHPAVLVTSPGDSPAPRPRPRGPPPRSPVEEHYCAAGARRQSPARGAAATSRPRAVGGRPGRGRGRADTTHRALVRCGTRPPNRVQSRVG